MKKYFFITALCVTSFFLGAFLTADQNNITKEDVAHASKIFGMNFTQSEIDSMLPLLEDQLKNIAGIRKFAMPNSIPPAFIFNPVPVGFKFDMTKKQFKTSLYTGTVLPKDMNELAYYSIGQLAELIKTKKISSVNLTKFFLERLKKYDKKLLCVITYTEELAMQEAKKADEEISKGKYKGLLHGIPFGVKDMYSTKSYNTSFGTPPYKNQLIDEDATIVKKLKEAGAVLCVKLSLGELAMDDTWFGGKTRCPWDTTRGSSGSSAGPAAAVSAGLLPFAIGSETWGSIVSPSTVCGVTGLRPTFGRVSKTGAMALCWSMDKVGPLCRNAEDCAIVLNTICGADGQDQSAIDVPFNYDADVKIAGMKIGFLKSDFEKDSVNKKFNDAAIALLEKLGAKLIPLELPKIPVNDLQIILFSECGAAFDELTQTNKDDMMVQQGKYAWPDFFRAAHFIPAVDYLQAMRARYVLIQEMQKIMTGVDVLLAPSLAGDNLLTTNLTGHPSLVLPNGFISEKTPTSIVFTGQLFGEGKLIAIAKAYQDATDFHKKHPPMFY